MILGVSQSVLHFQYNYDPKPSQNKLIENSHKSGDGRVGIDRLCQKNG